MAVAPRTLPPQVLAARLLPTFRAVAAGESLDDRDEAHIASLLAELAATRGSLDTARFRGGVRSRRSPVEFAATLSQAMALCGLDREAGPTDRLRRFASLVESARSGPSAAAAVLQVLEVANRLINGGETPRHATVERMTHYALQPDTMNPGERDDIEEHLRECPSCASDVEAMAERRGWLNQLPPAD